MVAARLAENQFENLCLRATSNSDVATFILRYLEQCATLRQIRHQSCLCSFHDWFCCGCQRGSRRVRRRALGWLGSCRRLQERSDSLPPRSVHPQLASRVLRFRSRALPLVWASTTIRILLPLRRILLSLKRTSSLICTLGVQVGLGLQSSCGVLQPQCKTETPAGGISLEDFCLFEN